MKGGVDHCLYINISQIIYSEPYFLFELYNKQGKVKNLKGA